MPHVATMLLLMSSQKTPHGIERVAKGDIHVRVGFLPSSVAAHADLFAGHGEIDFDVE